MRLKNCVWHTGASYECHSCPQIQRGLNVFVNGGEYNAVLPITAINKVAADAEFLCDLLGRFAGYQHFYRLKPVILTSGYSIYELSDSYIV